MTIGRYGILRSYRTASKGCHETGAQAHPASLTLPQRAHELLEQIVAVLRAGAGFGVVLDREGRLVGEAKPCEAAVEQRDVGGLSIGGERVGVHREAVVHAGDLDAARALDAADALHRMVRAAMTPVHLV